MPNWCENSLYIRSTVPGAVREFYQACHGKPAYWGLGEWEISNILNPEDVEELKKKDREDHDALPPKFCFNALAPVPQEIIDKGYSVQRADFMSDDDGYNWCITHWGTKWDIYHAEYFDGPEDRREEVTDEAMEVVCYFNTAWSPPLGWMQCAAKDFPNVELELSYFEPGGYFGGTASLVKDTYTESEWDEDRMQDEMKSRGYLLDPEEWKSIYREVAKDEARGLFKEGTKVYGIDEDGEASLIEIPEDLDDYDTFGTAK